MTGVAGKRETLAFENMKIRNALAFVVVIGVMFSTPTVAVDEDVPGGMTEVCFITDTPSAQPYTVVVGRRPSGENPATRKCVN